MDEAGIASALVAAAVVHGWASRPSRDAAGAATWRRWLGFAALAVAAVALLPPFDDVADEHLAAHMAQHLLLVSVAAPLVVAGLLVESVCWLGRVRLPRTVAPAVVVALVVVQAVTVIAWHAPVLYDAAVNHDVVHALEHLTLLLTAVAAWWAVANAAGSWRGLAVALLFVSALAVMTLGVAMTLATTRWYGVYDAGSPAAQLRDQQLAGVLMWAYGGLAAAVGAIAAFVVWLQSLERAHPSPAPAVPRVESRP
jgi:cytochrome c oxidase assembly factor CtaG